MTGRRAGRKRKNKRGGGRKPGQYSKLTPQEKLVYHQVKVRIARGLGSGDEGSRGGGESTGGQVDEEDVAESNFVLRGRPPLDKTRGKMSEEELKVRRRSLGKFNYKRKKIGELRRHAVSRRRDRMEAGGDGTSETYDGDIEEEEVIVGVEVGDIDREGAEKLPRTPISKSTEYRVRAAFLKLVPCSLANQLEVLRKLAEDFDDEAVKVDRNVVVDGIADRSTIYRYRYKISNFLVETEEAYCVEPATFILYWAQMLVCRDEEAFYKSGLQLLNKLDVPKEIRVKKISDVLATSIIRERRDPDCRMVSLKHAIEVAKAAGLHYEQKGDIVALERGIGSSHEFALKVLKAVDKNSTAKEMYKKKIRKDSVKETDMSARLTEFLSNGEHARALPGHESISVAYKCRRPKFLLKKSKNEILDIFKKEYSDVTFSHRVLLREWPANFVPPTHKDEERNVCPLHSNLRRCLDGLRKAGAASNLPKSVRGICSTTICTSPSTVPLDPSTWPQDCALGVCSSCPKLIVALPPNPNISVNFLQWKKSVSSKLDRNGDPKEIFNLFPVNVTLV